MCQHFHKQNKYVHITFVKKYKPVLAFILHLTYLPVFDNIYIYIYIYNIYIYIYIYIYNSIINSDNSTQAAPRN